MIDGDGEVEGSVESFEKGGGGSKRRLGDAGGWSFLETDGLLLNLRLSVSDSTGSN